MKNNPIARRIFKKLCEYNLQDEELGDHLAKVMKGKFNAMRLSVFERFCTDSDVIYVSDGFLICIGFDERGDIFVLGVYGADTIIASLSFNNQLPSDLEWIALPGSYHMRISHTDMEQVYQDFPKTRKLARIILADAWQGELKRRIGLSRKSDLVVLDFYTRFPEFLANEELLTDTEIASYLLLGLSTFRGARAKLLNNGKLKKRVSGS